MSAPYPILSFFKFTPYSRTAILVPSEVNLFGELWWSYRWLFLLLLLRWLYSFGRMSIRALRTRGIAWSHWCASALAR